MKRLPANPRRLRAATAALLAIGAPVLPAEAACPGATLVADGGEAGDRFGCDVAVDGDVAVVGAEFDEVDGVATGAAYVFRRGPSGWTQEQMLTAPAGGASHRFGISVDIEGDVVVVGASQQPYEFSGQAGAVHVFRHDGAAWAWEQELLAPTPTSGARLGVSVAISGAVILAGAEADDFAANDAGAAYVYRHDGAEWGFEQRLIASDAEALDLLGMAVALDGDVAIAGAICEGSLCTGAAYVFRRDGMTWSQEQKLVASDGLDFDNYGWSVAIEGDTAVVSTRKDDDAAPDAGSVFVYAFDGASWGGEQKLLPTDAGSEDFFGHGVALSGDRLVVGSRYHDAAADDAGAAYVYERAAGTWGFDGKLTAPTAAADDQLGFAVAVDAGRILAGAYIGAGAAAGAGFASLFEAEIGLDCNGNGVDDDCDIAAGTSDDDDGNGVPDECDAPPCPGDTNGDTTVDIDDLVNVILDFGTDGTAHGGDVDGSGVTDIDDVVLVVVSWGTCVERR